MLIRAALICAVTRLVVVIQQHHVLCLEDAHVHAP